MIKFLFCFFIFFINLNFWNNIIIIFIFLRLFIFLFFPLLNMVIFNYLFMDNLSFFLIILRIWILSIMFLARERIHYCKINENIFKLLLNFLLLILILSFMVNNLLLFYLFFEMRLIPTFLLILGWGYQPERLQAGLYLLFYTLVASLPLLIGIFYLKNLVYRLRILFFNNQIRLLLYFSLTVAFLVKIPIFLVHLWLPKAHVEAPISGSIILAGVLLKLGGYGLIRLIVILSSLNNIFNVWWIRIRLYGGRLISLNCLRQIDLKSLIAYSSVAHMGMVLRGLITLNSWGINGCFIIIIAHGLCSSGLFCLANITYERVNSRRMLISKGIINFIPSLSLWWFLLRASNMSSPPSLNLLGEINLINRLVAWSWLSIILIFFLSFFRASYCFYLFSYRQHGIPCTGLFRFSINFVREYLLLFLHWIPLNFLFLSSRDFLIYLNSLIKMLDCEFKVVFLF